MSYATFAEGSAAAKRLKNTGLDSKVTIRVASFWILGNLLTFAQFPQVILRCPFHSPTWD